MKVWKYPLREDVTDETIDVMMPLGSKIIHVGAQRDIPTLWALVDPGAAEEQRSFYVAATGEDLPEGQYLGTILQYNGAYVWHILEVT